MQPEQHHAGRERPRAHSRTCTGHRPCFPIGSANNDSFMSFIYNCMQICFTYIFYNLHILTNNQSTRWQPAHRAVGQIQQTNFGQVAHHDANTELNHQKLIVVSFIRSYVVNTTRGNRIQKYSWMSNVETRPQHYIARAFFTYSSSAWKTMVRSSHHKTVGHSLHAP